MIEALALKAGIYLGLFQTLCSFKTLDEYVLFALYRLVYRKEKDKHKDIIIKKSYSKEAANA